MAKRRLSFAILLVIFFMLTLLITLTKARLISIPPSPSPSIALAPSPEAGDAAPEKDQYKNLSPQILPPTPSPSLHTQVTYFPISDFYSPPPFSSQDASEPAFSPENKPPSTTTATATGGYDDGGDEDRWTTPPHQPSAPTESSYTRGDGDDGKNEYSRHEEENEKPTILEGNESGGGDGARVVFGLVMGVCFVGLGGLVCKKRRENDMRRRAKYVYLARREIF